MSQQADAARERRWKARGHARLTARISSSADDALTLLANHFHMQRREVVQCLLLAAGANVLGQGDPELIAIMHEHRMSRVEAEFLRDMRNAALHQKLPEYAQG
jgi:hypothetical protein